MGCNASSVTAGGPSGKYAAPTPAAVKPPPLPPLKAVSGRESGGFVRSISTDSTSSSLRKELSARLGEGNVIDPCRISSDHEAAALDRLKQFGELDKMTKVPFILVELRGLDNGHGYVVICGKDEYGVYASLDRWLAKTWQCTKLNADNARLDAPVPFCEAMYRWGGYIDKRGSGTNNMGLSTMQLVDFMCGELSWTLGMINGGNLGREGNIREQQIIFRSPHPMNLITRHMMVKLRTVGLIEVIGSDHETLRVLHRYFLDRMDAKPFRGQEEICDFCYSCSRFETQKRGTTGENNLGLLTTQVCDAVTSLLPGWSLVSMNGGNYGEDGALRDQRLVFRWDNHPLRENPHLLVELREAGFVQVCGQNVDGIYDQLESWLQATWGCKSAAPEKGTTRLCDKMFLWNAKDMLVASAELTGFFHQLGWQMQVSSQGVVSIRGKGESRERQILFRPHQHGGDGVIEPHIFVELYIGEGDEALYSDDTVTQVLGKQRIRVCSIGECGSADEELNNFLCNFLDALPVKGDGKVRTFLCDIFLSRGLTDCNLAMVTQRLRDFMVDHLGWRFVVCSVSNLGPLGVYREQQLIFRYDGGRREIPPVKESNLEVDWPLFAGLKFPAHWQNAEVLRLKRVVAIMPCDAEEQRALQEICDHTFKRVLTRDRQYDLLGGSQEMPYRLEIVHAMRSEHAELCRRFTGWRSERASPEASSFAVKTQSAGALLNDRLGKGEAFLFHGTNPSSAMGVLKNGFALDHAGKTTGTMLGYGVYCAESSSKADEYARDDGGGTYPGLMALLVCRCYIGKPYVVHDAGDHVTYAKQNGFDCVVGDRETKVGTYREFVIFDDHQVVPEYAIIYRRQYDSSKVPTSMVQAVRGTTGRNWQLLDDTTWRDLPPNIGFELSRAAQGGQVELLGRTIHGELSNINLARKEVVNVRTGSMSRLRPPMRR